MFTPFLLAVTGARLRRGFFAHLSVPILLLLNQLTRKYCLFRAQQQSISYCKLLKNYNLKLNTAIFLTIEIRFLEKETFPLFNNFKIRSLKKQTFKIVAIPLRQQLKCLPGREKELIGWESEEITRQLN